jgi:hypothetical protein
VAPAAGAVVVPSVAGAAAPPPAADAAFTFAAEVVSHAS